MVIGQAQHTDPRTEPGAYVTNGHRLYEVVEYKPASGMLALTNCTDDSTITIHEWMFRGQYKLVKHAPEVPTVIPEGERAWT